MTHHVACKGTYHEPELEQPGQLPPQKSCPASSVTCITSTACRSVLCCSLPIRMKLLGQGTRLLSEISIASLSAFWASSKASARHGSGHSETLQTWPNPSERRSCSDRPGRPALGPTTVAAQDRASSASTCGLETATVIMCDLIELLSSLWPPACPGTASSRLCRRVQKLGKPREAKQTGRFFLQKNPPRPRPKTPVSCAGRSPWAHRAFR